MKILVLAFLMQFASVDMAMDVRSISLTFHNSSAKSIPLIIPGVMNPNLSPFSNSGVTLAIGQKVLFKYKGKKQLLLEVNDSYRDGQKIDIAKEIRERKKEIDER